jgi:hypothetical protein
MAPLTGLAVPLPDVRGWGLTLTSDGTSHRKHDVEIKEIPRIGLVQCPLSRVKNKIEVVKTHIRERRDDKVREDIQNTVVPRP